MPKKGDKPQPLRTLNEIRADIISLERETVGLLYEIIGVGHSQWRNLQSSG